MEGRIDPEEERRHREVMRGLGVYDASWALCKVMEQSDIQRGQNRLLITRTLVQDGSLPKVFPELEQLDDDGKNAQNELSVTILNADGVEKVVILLFLNSNKAYRIRGSEWSEFVEEGGFSKGDRLDVYTCKRGDGERCLFFFKSKGGCGGGGGGGSPRSNGRRRSRQQAAISDSVADDIIDIIGHADNGSGKRDARDSNHRANTRGQRGDRSKDYKRGKNGHVKKEDMLFVINDDDVQASTGDSQGGCCCVARSNNDTHDGCCRAETTSEEAAAWRLWDNATPIEREAAAGLLMLKWATYDEDIYLG